MNHTSFTHVLLVIIISLVSCTNRQQNANHYESSSNDICLDKSLSILGSISDSISDFDIYDKTVITDSLLLDIKNQISYESELCKLERDKYEKDIIQKMKREDDTAKLEYYNGCIKKYREQKYLLMSPEILIEIKDKAYQITKRKIVGDKYCGLNTKYVNTQDLKNQIKKYVTDCPNNANSLNMTLNIYYKEYNENMGIEIPIVDFEPYRIKIDKDSIKIVTKQKMKVNGFSL